MSSKIAHGYTGKIKNLVNGDAYYDPNDYFIFQYKTSF